MTAQTNQLVFVGVDTHADIHVAAAVTATGQRLGTAEFETTPEGYSDLAKWAESLGDIACFGVEGTGSYGTGLTRHLRGRAAVVLEVNRPNRQHRRRYGKSDHADAYAAAAAAASGTVFEAKHSDPEQLALRAAHTARKAAVAARTRVINQIRQLIVTSPDTINLELNGLTIAKLIKRVNAHDSAPNDPVDVAGVWATLQSLARIEMALKAEIKLLEKQRRVLIRAIAPTLLNELGVGETTATELVLAVGANPDRFTSEAAFAATCGVSPVEASSGKHTRHRLNKGGNRQANCALHTIALCRSSRDPETITYIAKKRAEGKTEREARRSLKRHLARRIYNTLKHDLTNHKLT